MTFTAGFGINYFVLLKYFSLDNNLYIYQCIVKEFDKPYGCAFYKEYSSSSAEAILCLL